MLVLCIGLVGCNANDDDIKGEFDLKGTITEIDVDRNRILVKETESELIWVTIPDSGKIEDYDEGQEVTIWLKGLIAESAPSRGKALNIEIITPERNIP